MRVLLRCGTMARSIGRQVMLNGIFNLRASEIELRQQLPKLESDWLVGTLRAHPGIAGATCASDARHLTIEYDGDRLVSDDLVAFLNECGVSVARVHAGHA
jgi:hypothetical protein